jgi:3-hydroxyisobutyrate dehydrogenase-like beta-hydroxyacid dehydrogenase
MAPEPAIAAAAPPRAGIIGLGMIGGGVAVSLVRSGQVPAVFDVREDASNALTGVPPQLTSPADVARVSDVVLVAVVTAEQVEDVLIGENGLLMDETPGLLVVLLSTVSLSAVRHLAKLCVERGAVLLDAGVSGGPAAYDNGLTVMIGGRDEHVERAMPVLEGFAKTVVHCGPVGAGMVAKLAKNVVTYASWAVVREAASLAIAGGVALQRFIDIVEPRTDTVTDPLVWLRLKEAGIEVPEDVLAQYEQVADKDLSAVQELAAELMAEMPLTDVVQHQIGDIYRNRLSDNAEQPRSGEC